MEILGKMKYRQRRFGTLQNLQLLNPPLSCEMFLIQESKIEHCNYFVTICYVLSLFGMIWYDLV